MKNKTFVASQFISTLKFDTAEDKAKFANQFVKFVEGGYLWKDFPKWFYIRLSMTFGHIAHYNQGQFYETFFTSNEGKADFRQETLHYPCYGQPEYTYCDVEKALQAWLRHYTFQD
jgi:hypothetical protein